MAQDPAFFNDRWKIKTVQSIYNGIKTYLFNKDSVDNIFDYTDFEIKFKPNGSYAGKDPKGKAYSGSWSFNSKKDSVVIDSVQYLVTQLSSSYFTTRAYALQLSDTLGNTDTSYTYFTLYSLPDIISNNSLYDIVSNIQVYPIPAVDQLNIEWNEQNTKGIKEFHVSSIYGQAIKVIPCGKKNSHLTIDISDLANGFYSLEIINTEGEKIGMKKIIKQ